MQGVLKSWAVPKEPPLDEGAKRLAVAVPDHELGYEKFEGIIPEGEYGAGTVKIWDRGTYIPKEITPNKLTFDINGKRLKGTYCLVKLKPKLHQDKNWLLFKKRTD